MGETRRKKTRRVRGWQKRHRWQGTHPVTGARWSLSARTAGDLVELVARSRRIGFELRSGMATTEQAMVMCAALEGKRVLLPGMLRVADAWAAYLPTITNPGTKTKAESVWRKHLEPHVGSLTVIELTDGKLRELVAGWLRSGLSASMVRSSVWAFLSASVRHAKASKKIERLPWDDFKPPKARQRRPAAARDVGELEALIRAARADDATDRRRAFERLRGEKDPLCDLARRVTVLALCGLRNGEGAGLAWDHLELDVEPGSIHIEYQALDQWQRHFPDRERPTFPVKAGARVQTLHPDARAALLEQRAELERRGWYREDGPVFPTLGGVWRKNANCVYPEDLKAIAVKSGISKPLSWVTHSLRHSFATLELRSGNDPRTVQARTGHASLRQLEGYIHDAAAAPSAIPRLGNTIAKEEESPP